MTCKDNCLHYDVCWHIKKTNGVDFLKCGFSCIKFKDKSKYIELPCKVGDMVYVIPSLTNFRLNIANGYTENNRVYEQKVHSIQMWNADEWCLWACDGINPLLQKFYKETWFLTKAEAEAKLKELKENAKV